jgi:hypothetical protein
MPPAGEIALTRSDCSQLRQLQAAGRGPSAVRHVEVIRNALSQVGMPDPSADLGLTRCLMTFGQKR